MAQTTHPAASETLNGGAPTHAVVSPTAAAPVTVPAQNGSPAPGNDDFLPCPPWCVAHSTDAEVMAEKYPWSETCTEIHSSAWRVWGGGDFDVKVDPSDLAVLCDGFLSCNSMRDFGRFLVALADEVDPHGTDGRPVEWERLDQ